ncbi:MAG: prolyl oligopeptidase family serine peptidase [Negativicutes bacterium]|nr:prolyl oligopeptidase family serine peptidase [Negativicutes bacterium]
MRQRIVTRRMEQIDDFHGTPVADPDRWLEDDFDPEVRAWTAAQNAETNAYLQQYAIHRQLQERLTSLYRYPKQSLPLKKAGKYYSSRNSGLQNQSVIYQHENLNDLGRIVLDPNLLSEDGTVEAAHFEVSPRGNFCAYGLSQSGSDWQRILVKDLRQDLVCSDEINWVKFTQIAWLPDETGFFYTRFPDPATVAAENISRDAKIYLHRLAEAQADDTLVYENKEHPDWGFSLSVSDNGKWQLLLIRIGTDPRSLIWFRPLDSQAEFIPLVNEFQASFDLAGWLDNRLFLRTNQNAPMGCLLAVDLTLTAKPNWQTVLPEKSDLLDEVRLVHHQIICTYLKDAAHVLERYDAEGNFLRQIPLPALGTVRGLSGGAEDEECFILFNSFLYPDTILRYDCKTEETDIWFCPRLDFPFDQFETIRVFYPSKDGTQIPMFITRSKAIKLDGHNPTLLYGYGGFSINRTPNFSPQVLAWLQAGGVHAEPCLRGGAEYGEAWHLAGTLANKQNVFDDYIAAAEWLIAQNYTCRRRLGIMGRSNGGLLTGACLTQRPDLYGAVIVWVPVLDMLRYHRFTVGRYWTGEYGNAEQNPEHFQFMYAYSPLHNVKMNRVYPPTLIMTADMDDRVVPCQARKFTATLQAADAGSNPILLRVEKSAGHGHGKPISKLIEEQTDLYAFLMIQLMDQREKV